MSQFFESIKASASGYAKQATKLASEMVNEYMEGEGEGDYHEGAKEGRKKEASQFFANFLPEVDAWGGDEIGDDIELDEVEEEKDNGDIREDEKKEEKEKKGEEEKQGETVEHIPVAVEQVSPPVEETKTPEPNPQPQTAPVPSPSNPFDAFKPSSTPCKSESPSSQTPPPTSSPTPSPSKPSTSSQPALNLSSSQVQTLANKIVFDQEAKSNRLSHLNDIHAKLIRLVEFVNDNQGKLSFGSPGKTENASLVSLEEVKKNIGAEETVVGKEPSSASGSEVNEELIKGAMEKFDQFWTDILKKFERVTSKQMNPNVPDFERLFKSLTKPEKKHFKPFLKILAHSLQFLDKMSTLDTKLTNLKQELKELEASQDPEKIKLLENQIIKLQKNCQDFINSEETLKRQLSYMQEKNRELDEDMNRAAKDILDLKKQLQKVKTEKTQLANSLNEATLSNDVEVVREERDQLKKRISELINEVQDKDNTIDEMALKINELKETEMKYLDSCEERQHLVKQLEETQRDLDLNRISMENLQNALNEQQESYDWTINDLEKEKNEHEETIKRLEDTIQTIQKETKEKVVDTTQVDELEKINEQLTSDIDHLVIQKEALTKELETAKDQIKTQELSKGNLIDRRVINQFLVQYLNHQSAPSVKKQMLESMASILEFSNEEKQLLGILEAPKEEGQKSDIGAQFLDFLMGEDEED